MDFIGLLSGKPIENYTPTLFKQLVISLKQEKRKAKSRVVKVKPPYKARLTSKGRISVIAGRKEKYLTDAEMKQISHDFKVPLNELFLYLKKRGITVQ